MSNCGCDDLCRNLSLLTGDKGDSGANGLDGTFGANSDLYIFNTATVGNPTNTKLLFNNANLSAATSISVSNVDGYGNTVSGWLNLVGTSDATLKAFIRVNKEFDSTAFVMYAVTAQTANAGYYTYTITYVGGSSNSPFALNDNVVFSYVISGNNGTDGTPGSVILYNNCTTVDSGDTSGISVALKSFNIPANTFVSDGDCVTVIANNECNDSQLPGGAINIDYDEIQVLNNAVSATFSGNGIYANNFQFREFKLELNRVTSTTLRITSHVLDSNNIVTVSYADMAGLDFTLVTNISVFANTTVALASVSGYVKSLRLFIKYEAI